MSLESEFDLEQEVEKTKKEVEEWYAKLNAVDSAFPKEYAALCESDLSDKEWIKGVEELYARIPHE